MDYPVLIFVSAVLLQWLAACLGSLASQRRQDITPEIRPDFSAVQGAILTLLGLIIGFSFSMATARYDLRRSYEAAEAGAIGTVDLRADLVPTANAAEIRRRLRRYTDLRIEFFRARREDEIQKIDAEAATLQRRMWELTVRPAIEQPNSVTALAVTGMSDLSTAEGNSQAALRSRIPMLAWGLLFIIAMFANGMLGYGARQMRPKLFFLLPLALGIAFLLVAEIDNPRQGIVHIVPRNLLRARASLGD